MFHWNINLKFRNETLIGLSVSRNTTVLIWSHYCLEETVEISFMILLSCGHHCIQILRTFLLIRKFVSISVIMWTQKDDWQSEGIFSLNHMIQSASPLQLRWRVRRETRLWLVVLSVWNESNVIGLFCFHSDCEFDSHRRKRWNRRDHVHACLQIHCVLKSCQNIIVNIKQYSKNSDG